MNFGSCVYPYGDFWIWGQPSYYYYNWQCWKYRVWHPVVVTPLCPVNTFWRKRFWYVLLVNGMDEVFTLSFFQLMHLPLHASSKRKGLFDCFSSVIKNDLLQLFCRIPVKIGKMFPNSYIFINFVLFSSGKTKFSMASCVYIIQYVEAVEHNSWTFEVHFDRFSVFQTVCKCWPLSIGSWRCFVTFTSLLLWGDSYDIRVTSARAKVTWYWRVQIRNTRCNREWPTVVLKAKRLDCLL